MRGRVLIDVFFLRIVNARDRFDRLDDPLSVAQRQSVDFPFGEALGQAGQQMGEMKEFAMHPAHRRKAIAAGERATQSRIDLRFVGALVGDEVFCDDGVCFADQLRAFARLGRVQRGGDVAQPVEALPPASHAPRATSSRR